ncbi:hypothetical protein [Janthinobacterium fluminis]|uniref:Uncharacterized protein n=1 Tax=Janthinobacterium fluminis TaxID=2987524 RepID=A0ABT5K4J7_9BURK|nr:hypothetical protein [Janthinobacterium fluminis]MDC8759908.1 hypothetical protein [Janthinobacterium fluminis]
MIIDMKMPSLEEILARSTVPEKHTTDVIVGVGSLVFWKRRADLDGSEGVTFFDGDMRDVLESDDPRIIAALEREHAHG